MKRMNAKNILFYAALTLAVGSFFFTSCSRKNAVYKTKLAYLDTASMTENEPMMESKAGNFAGAGYNASTTSNGTSASPVNVNRVPEGRKLIKTGNIQLSVSSLADTKKAADIWIQQFGGYISDSSEDSDSLSLTVHVPKENFDKAMAASGSMGKVASKSVNSTDVTDQYYDLDTRLSTRRVLLERLETYLKQAKDMKDMLDIETKINDVTTEIENMQGDLNRLTKQIDYSQIDVYAKLPVNQTEEGFVLPDTKSQFREFGGNILSFFNGFMFVILYIIIYGIPSILMLFVLYWLCFGKVGLLRKLFAKVRASKNEKTTTDKK